MNASVMDAKEAHRRLQFTALRRICPLCPGTTIQTSSDLLQHLTECNAQWGAHASPEELARYSRMVVPGTQQTSPEQEGDEKDRLLQLLGLAITLHKLGQSYTQALDEMRFHNANLRCSDADIEATLQLVFSRTVKAGTGFATTEAGDAEYFAVVYGDRVRYDHRRDRWLILNDDSGIWLPDQVEALTLMGLDLMRLRQRCASSVLLKQKSDDNKDLKASRFKWAISGESAGRLRNMLQLARAMPPIADAGDNWDSDPYLLGCPNGVVDLRTGELRKGRPEDRVTMRTAVAYDPDATCPLWTQTLADIFDGKGDVIAYVHRLAGYATTGDVREEMLGIAYGDGGAGKGTTTQTIGGVLGDYSTEVPATSIMRLRHENDGAQPNIVRLEHKRFVTVSEVGPAELNTERIKMLTGRDKIVARALYTSPIEFYPEFKMLLSCNTLPVLEDDSDGIWRRVHVLPFTQSFVGKANLTLKNDLRKEYAGILTWLVQGALAWQREGLKPPQDVRAATKKHREDTDWSVRRFINERCIKDPDARISSSTLYDAYVSWCEGEEMSQKAFSIGMHKQFEKKPTKNGTVFLDVRLLTDDELEARERDAAVDQQVSEASTDDDVPF